MPASRSPFSNDRIICYGSFDSSLIFHPSPSLPLASPLRRRRASPAGPNNGASSNVAAAKYQSVEGSQGDGRVGDSGRWGAGGAADISGCPSGACAVQTVLFLKLEGFHLPFFCGWELKKWYYGGLKRLCHMIQWAIVGRGARGVEHSITRENCS